MNTTVITVILQVGHDAPGGAESARQEIRSQEYANHRINKSLTASLPRLNLDLMPSLQLESVESSFVGYCSRKGLTFCANIKSDIIISTQEHDPSTSFATPFLLASELRHILNTQRSMLDFVKVQYISPSLNVAHLQWDFLFDDSSEELNNQHEWTFGAKEQEHFQDAIKKLLGKAAMKASTSNVLVTSQHSFSSTEDSSMQPRRKLHVETLLFGEDGWTKSNQYALNTAKLVRLNPDAVLQHLKESAQGDGVSIGHMYNNALSFDVGVVPKTYKKNVAVVWNKDSNPAPTAEPAQQYVGSSAVDQYSSSPGEYSFLYKSKDVAVIFVGAVFAIAVLITFCVRPHKVIKKRILEVTYDEENTPSSHTESPEKTFDEENTQSSYTESPTMAAF